MKMTHLIPRCLWHLLVVLVFTIIATTVRAQDNDPHALGLRPPTADEQIMMQRNLVKTRHVRLNAIGLQRVNAVRRAHGKPELPASDAVPIGEEVTAGADAMPGVNELVGSDPPHIIDNSTLKYFPPIRSQETTGSCACFAANYYAMTHMVALARNWDAKTGGDTKRFSPKWTYNMINGGSDSGSWITTAYSVMQRHGSATWTEFPYNGDASNPLNYREWCVDPDVWRNAINVRMDQQGSVASVDTQAGIDNVKALLINGYVLNYATNIYAWQFTTTKNDPDDPNDDSYVGKSVCYWLNNGGGGHAMTVVGFNDYIWTDINNNNAVDAGEKGAFRIANSWGTGWYEGGYTWLAYDALKATSAIPGAPNASRQAAWWYNTAYWITARASYSPKMVARFKVNHAQRNQLAVLLGVSDMSRTTPSTTWYPNALYYQGGAFAFNGTTTACDGEFVFDVSDIITQYGTPQRWYVDIVDSSTAGSAFYKSYKLIDVAHGNLEIPATYPETEVNGTTGYFFVQHTFHTDPQPDLQIRNPGETRYDGDNIYNILAGQTKTQAVTVNNTAVYHVKLQNDSSAADTINLTGISDSDGWTIRYFRGLTGTDEITNMVGATGCPIALSGYGSIDLRIEVTASTAAARYQGKDVILTAVSGNSASCTDNVCATSSRDNAAPVASSGSLTVSQDTPTSGTLVASDADGDTLTYSVVTPPAHGSVVIDNANTGAYTYTPAAEYSGTDSFSFKVSDGMQNSNSAIISISVNSDNHVPVANDQAVSTDEDTAKALTLTANDADGNPLTFTVLIQPGHGTLSGTAPNVTYTPAVNYNGPDSFTFKVNDGKVDSNIATVSITVLPVNDAPTANGQSVTTDEDVAKAITLTGADVDGNQLAFIVVTQPANGTLSGTAPNLTYTPRSNYNGSDSLTFKVSDGALESAIMPVNITVNPINDPPTANYLQVGTKEDTALAIKLTGSDPEGDALTFAIVDQPMYGTLSGTVPNLVYTPNPNYYGSDRFTFKANDGRLDSNSAPVYISISPVNDPPVANNQAVTTDEDIAKAITLTATDDGGSDSGGGLTALTYTVLTQPAHGTLSGTAPNLIYTPAVNYNGPDSLTFKVNDGQYDSNTATISITVSPVNDAPTANEQSVVTDEDNVKGIILDGNDVDGDQLAYVIATQPLHGTLSGTAPNLVYTPANNYNGPDSFTFMVNDGTADSNVAVVSITVNSVNDNPVANPDNANSTPGTAVTLNVLANDSDIDGGTLSVSAVTQGAKGTVVVNANNTVTYTPNAGALGSDSFTYTISDGQGGLATATVTISIGYPPLTQVTLTVNPTTCKINTTVTLTATRTGGTNVEYMFRIGYSNRGKMVWTNLRTSYSTNPIQTWTPTTATTYTVEVWAREVGHTNNYDVNAQITYIVKKK